ncbi:MAG: VWA domain-containing protein [Sulfolobales archaeon]
MREITLENLVDFIRILRENGFRIGISEDIDAYAAINKLGISGDIRNEYQRIGIFREALRITLVKDPGLYELFDKLFDMYWLMDLDVRHQTEKKIEVRVIMEGEAPDPIKKFLSIYSPLEIRGRSPKDVMLDPSVRNSIRRILRIIGKKISTRPGIRRTISLKGEISFPLSYREAISTLGDIVKLKKTRRKMSRTHYVFLIDVSGSMEETWENIAKLLRAIKGLSPSSYEVFLFSTDLVRATDAVQMGERVVRDLLARSGIWGSGTRIGESLYKLLNSYKGYLQSESLLLIISDGWDLGDLELLEKSLVMLKKIVSKILWLSPYAGKKGFAPETMCLRIASKYVDAILPTELLYDIVTLRRYLKKLSTI